MLPFDVWRRGKSLCCSSIEHDSIEHDYHLQTACFFLPHRISRAILGSQDALIEVGEVLPLWPAVIAALHAWRHPYCRISGTTSLGNLTSLIGYLRQNWPRKHFAQHFTSSLPDWYVAAESRITTSIWCTGLALAVTSKPICLKSSTQASTGQLLFRANLGFYWTTFSVSLAETATPSLFVGNLTSLIGYLRQNWPRKHFMQHFTTSLPDWYVAAESRTTTSICNEHCRASAMTSKPICLKSSQVATGQLLFQQILTFAQLWTAVSSANIGSPSFM